MIISSNTGTIENQSNDSKIKVHLSAQLPFLMRFLSPPYLEEPGKGSTLSTSVKRETTDDR